MYCPKPAYSWILLSLLTISGRAYAAEDSIMFRCNPSHTGVADGKAVVPGTQSWKFSTGGKIRSTPAVRGGVAYFGSEDGLFYAVSLKEGKEIWRHRTGADNSSSPAIVGSNVLFLSRDGAFHAVDIKSGVESWRIQFNPDMPGRKGDYLGWDLWLSSPSIEGETAFVGGGDGKVYAIDVTKGKVRWSFQTKQRVRSCPAVSGGRVYVGSFDGNVYALDAATGMECWRYDTRGAIQSSPAVAEGMVFIGSRSAAVFALDAMTGALKWRTRHPNGSWVLGSPAVASGKVIVGSSDEQFLQALDTKSGQEVWRLNTRFRVLGSPVVVGDVVLSGSEGAHLHTVDLATGLLLGITGAEGPIHTSPVPTDELVLIGSDDSHLRAFRASDAPTRPFSDDQHLQACVGDFEERPGSILSISKANGYLKLSAGGFPPALVFLGADGIFHCPAYGLELKVVAGDKGEGSKLAMIEGEKETPLKRLR